MFPSFCVEFDVEQRSESFTKCIVVGNELIAVCARSGAKDVQKFGDSKGRGVGGKERRAREGRKGAGPLP